MKHLSPILLFLLFLSCSGRQEPVSAISLCDSDFVTAVRDREPYTPYEEKLLAFGLVDVQALDPSIQVQLVYATPDNFMEKALYADLHHAFLLPEMAMKIVAAQRAIHRCRPDLDLLILDAVRPLSVQYKMFHEVAGTPQNVYVSNPLHGPGMHNYGAAVDVTLADSLGRPLPMGSPFDHFGKESHIDHEDRLLSDGSITREELDNRRLLRRVMREQGLLTIPSEWWHFNLMSRAEARRRLKVVDI